MIKYKSYIPSKTDGIVLCFASEDVENELAIIPKTGETIVQGKILISLNTDYMAVFIDSEGNRIALFSRT
ncbi:MAG: VOC family protein [Kordia sp.]|uniref:VOC family protein n=1 Tax=Kordia sp. TaxID=1965332 RepID=UPI00385C6738